MMNPVIAVSAMHTCATQCQRTSVVRGVPLATGDDHGENKRMASGISTPNWRCVGVCRWVGVPAKNSILNTGETCNWYINHA